MRRLKRPGSNGRNDAKSFLRSNGSNRKQEKRDTAVSGREEESTDAAKLPDLERLRVSSAEGGARTDAGDEDQTVMNKENGMGTGDGKMPNTTHTPNRPSTNPPSGKSGFRFRLRAPASRNAPGKAQSVRGSSRPRSKSAASINSEEREPIQSPRSLHSLGRSTTDSCLEQVEVGADDGEEGARSDGNNGRQGESDDESVHDASNPLKGFTATTVEYNVKLDFERPSAPKPVSTTNGGGGGGSGGGGGGAVGRSIHRALEASNSRKFDLQIEASEAVAMPTEVHMPRTPPARASSSESGRWPNSRPGSRSRPGSGGRTIRTVGSGGAEVVDTDANNKGDGEVGDGEPANGTVNGGGNGGSESATTNDWTGVPIVLAASGSSSYSDNSPSPCHTSSDSPLSSPNGLANGTLDGPELDTPDSPWLPTTAEPARSPLSEARGEREEGAATPYDDVVQSPGQTLKSLELDLAGGGAVGGNNESGETVLSRFVSDDGYEGGGSGEGGFGGRDSSPYVTGTNGSLYTPGSQNGSRNGSTGGSDGDLNSDMSLSVVSSLDLTSSLTTTPGARQVSEARSTPGPGGGGGGGGGGGSGDAGSGSAGGDGSGRSFPYEGLDHDGELELDHESMAFANEIAQQLANPIAAAFKAGARSASNRTSPGLSNASTNAPNPFSNPSYNPYANGGGSGAHALTSNNPFSIGGGSPLRPANPFQGSFRPSHEHGAVNGGADAAERSRSALEAHNDAVLRSRLAQAGGVGPKQMQFSLWGSGGGGGGGTAAPKQANSTAASVPGRRPEPRVVEPTTNAGGAASANVGESVGGEGSSVDALNLVVEIPRPLTLDALSPVNADADAAAGSGDDEALAKPNPEAEGARARAAVGAASAEAGEGPGGSGGTEAGAEAESRNGGRSERFMRDPKTRRDSRDASHPASVVEMNTDVLTDVRAETPRKLQWKRGELLGRGTFGQVYLGLNERSGKLFAVKQVGLSDDSFMDAKNLMREITLMKDLDHRHIVRYLGTQIENEKNLFYIFLEYVPGGSIASLLAQFGVFNEALIQRYTQQILQGVVYLHEKGIVHRDIKGANVLVNEQGVAKLADFGCSKQLQGLCSNTLEESMKVSGSVPWMAPEVIKQSGYGRSSDVWSIGATVIEMATAHHPWPALSNNFTAIFEIANATSPPAIPETLSDDGRDFLRCALVIDPKARASSSELVEHVFLEGVIEDP